MRYVIIVAGIVVAAVGGAIAYRALFIEPSAAVVISSSSGEVSEVPNYAKVVGGSILFVFGAAIAFITARRKRVA